ncbi:MAG: hypothetical protein JXQ96_13275 [Cyclobacteriaceae bacterium]
MENNEFLKYFINEDLYHVEEKVTEPKEKEYAGETENSTEVVPKVEEPKVQLESSEVMEEVELKYKGANAKGILVLVEDANAEFLNDKDLQYLLKILGAVKLSLEEIALVNIVNQKSVDSLDFQKALLFTSNHNFSLDNTEKYSALSHNEKTVLVADPVDQIAASVELRKSLWGALQGMFLA